MIENEHNFNYFIHNVNYPQDIKLAPQYIVVLKYGNPCIQFYDYSYQLIREIITKGEVNR